VNRGFTAANRESTAVNRGFTAAKRGFTAAKRGFTAVNRGFTAANRESTAVNRGFTAANLPFSDLTVGLYTFFSFIFDQNSIFEIICYRFTATKLVIFSHIQTKTKKKSVFTAIFLNF
jgi:hypothetical protein